MSIKQTPNDFHVQEVLGPEFRAKMRTDMGDYAVYRLTKRSLSTPEAVELMAKALRLPVDVIAVAGLKDKHAQTSQHVTVPAHLTGRPTPCRLPRDIKAGGWNVHRLAWSPEPITSKVIVGNRFEINLRNMDQRECDLMDGALKLLTSADPTVVPFINYFGRQRFGAIRHGGEFPARELILGHFEEALRLLIAAPATQDRPIEKDFKQRLAAHWGKWKDIVRTLPSIPMKAAVEKLARGGSFKDAFAALPYFIQQINVEAYQSYLWNATASVLVRQRCEAAQTWDAARDPLELMCFPGFAAVPDELRGLDLPLLSPKTMMDRTWAKAAQQVLDAEEIRQEQLRIPGLHRPFFGQSPRRLFVDATKFRLSPPVPETVDAGKEIAKAAKAAKPARPSKFFHKSGPAGARSFGPRPADAAKPPRDLGFSRRIAFQLPRGAYATVLLAALGQ